MRTKPSAPKPSASPKSARTPSARAKAVRPPTASRAAGRAAASSSTARRSAKAAAPRLTLAEVMRELERAGSAQTRKTYTRHGAPEPMFGVSFATLKALTKRIGVDHELALGLWATGNFDARNLAVKVVDPARLSPSEMDRWVAEGSPSRMCGGYVAMLAAETPHGRAKAEAWLGSRDEKVRQAGWVLLGQLAQRDVSAPDAGFVKRVEEIEQRIHTAPNAEREAMNGALIALGGRNAALRQRVLAAAKRIGPVEVDHGDTACQTPDAAAYVEKCWAHAKAKGAASPAEQERGRDVPRLRC